MSDKSISICGKCGVSGVKIYRDYGMFRRPEEDRCNECLDGKTAWMVPCIMDKEGNAWGYTSVPVEDCEAFYALPEKSDNHPIWLSPPNGGWSDCETLIKKRASRAKWEKENGR